MHKEKDHSDLQQKVQIPKVRGNLSSFNDHMNFQSMILENDALDSLRNMSEDVFDQQLSIINSSNNLEQNQLQNNINSITNNNIQNQNLSSFNLQQTQQNSNEKRKAFIIAGWDNNNCLIEDNKGEQIKPIVQKRYNIRRSSSQLNQNEQRKQYSQQQTLIPQQLIKLSKNRKYSLNNFNENKADQIHSFQQFQEQQTKIRCPSQIDNRENQRGDIFQDINQLKNIKLLQLLFEQNNVNLQSFNQNDILPIQYNIERTQYSLNSYSNRKLQSKKVQLNQKNLELRQKVLAQMQQQSLRNLKTAQHQSTQYINSNTLHQKQPSFLSKLIFKLKQTSSSEKIDKHLKNTVEEINNFKRDVNKLPFDKYMEQKMKPRYSDIGSNLQTENIEQKIQCLSLLRDPQRQTEIYQHRTEISPLKTEIDQNNSSLSNERQTQSYHNLRGNSAKYSNYIQKLNRNIQNRINCIEKQLSNIGVDDQNNDLSIKDGTNVQNSKQKSSNKFVCSSQNTLQNQDNSPSQNQIIQLTEFPNNFKVFQLNTYNNYNRTNTSQQKSIDSFTGRSSTLSPNQMKSSRVDNLSRNNTNTNSNSNYNQKIQKLNQQKSIFKDDSTQLNNNLIKKYHARSSLQIHRKIDFSTNYLHDTSLQYYKPQAKTSNASLNIQQQIEQQMSQNQGNLNNTNNKINNNNINPELKAKYSSNKSNNILMKKTLN